MSSLTISTSNGASQSPKLELPSIRQILADLPSNSSPLETRTETVDPEAQQEMFRGLRDIIENAQVDETEVAYDLKELHASLEEAEASSKRGRRDAKTLRSVCDTLHRLWTCKSEYLAQAAEIIANGSRDRESIPSIDLFGHY